MASFSRDDIRVCRVLHEDYDLMTVEVVKNEERSLRLNEGDQFLTLVFIHEVDGELQVWTPWDAQSQEGSPE